MDIRGSVVLVTGSSRGLGKLIAMDLARSGAHVVLSARDARALEEVAASIRSEGGHATTAPGDVSVPEDRRKVLAEAQSLGPVDVLVNNAAIETPVSVIDQLDPGIDDQLAINLAAPIHLTRAVLPGMLARKRGAVVMISSLSGKASTPYNAIYAATKHGLNGFTSSLRIELAGTGVHAGVVCPGFVAETGLWASYGARAPALMREVPPQKVVAAVRRVLDGAPEVLVAPGPVRPMLALRQLFPSLEAPLMARMGVLRSLQDRAAVAAGRRAPPVARRDST